MTMLGQDTSRGRFRRSLPILASACIGLILSGAAWFAVSVREDRLAALEFSARADSHLLILQGGINTYLTRIVALRALYKADDHVTRTEFQTFSDELLQGQTAILAVSWIPRVSHAERAAHELAAVRDGLSGYRITAVAANGDLVTSSERAEYFPVRYSSREPPGSRVYGLDLNDGGLRQQTLERARDTNQFATSPGFTLRSGEGNRSGFFIVEPVYRADRPHDTVEDRRRNLIGFVQGVFQTGVLIETILAATTAPSGLDLYILAANSSPDASPLHFHPSRRRAVATEPQPLQTLT